MATKRISDLTAVNLVSGSAIIPVVQDGTTVKITFANLTGSIAGLGATPATASYALTALTASYAVSASHEITFELSSSYAETATSASHALTSNTATSASHALTASFATTASHALTASLATTASYALTASLATTASYALTASFATTASYALNALTASYAPSTPAPLEGAGFMGSNSINFYSDPTVLKRDNLIVHESNVAIKIPLASNFALGTVVEFDIFIPTGSTWIITTYDQAGNGQSGFMHQGYKGFNQVDFNPSFAPWFGPYKYFGFPGFYNGSAGSFGDLTGDYYHNGPALVRLVAVANSFDPTNPTTPATTPMGSLWLARIIARQPISNSVGTGLAVETVTALPTSNNSTGDLVMFDAGSGLKLHVYNGTSWDAV